MILTRQYFLMSHLIYSHAVLVTAATEFFLCSAYGKVICLFFVFYLNVFVSKTTWMKKHEAWIILMLVTYISMLQWDPFFVNAGSNAITWKKKKLKRLAQFYKGIGILITHYFMLGFGFPFLRILHISSHFNWFRQQRDVQDKK